jgi:hypothetical protein
LLNNLATNQFSVYFVGANNWLVRKHLRVFKNRNTKADIVVFVLTENTSNTIYLFVLAEITSNTDAQLIIATMYCQDRSNILKFRLLLLHIVLLPLLSHTNKGIPVVPLPKLSSQYLYLPLLGMVACLQIFINPHPCFYS